MILFLRESPSCQHPRTQTQEPSAKRGRHWRSGGPRPTCPWHNRSDQAPAPPFRPPHADTTAGWCCEARQAATEGLELQQVRRPSCDVCSGLAVTRGARKLYSKDRLEELHPRFPASADDKLDDLQDDAQDATTFTKDCSKVPIGWADIAPRDRLSEFFHSSRFNFLAFTLFFLLRGFICNRFQFLTFGQKPKSSIESCPFLD